MGRIPRQPHFYKGRSFPDCPTTDPPELEIADPMLGLQAGTAYTQEFALYALLEPQPECEALDYFCFINQLRQDIRAAAGVPPTQLLNNTGYMYLNSKNNPIAKLGGNEEYEWGLANYSMPWEDWSQETLASTLAFQGFGWVISAVGWRGERMNCSYNNGIQDCMGTCVLEDEHTDAEEAERLVAERVTATGHRALRYFHAEISTEANASTKYADSVMTNPSGEQYFYACDKYYGLYLPNTTNSYGKALLRSVEKAFTLGFTGDPLSLAGLARV